MATIHHLNCATMCPRGKKLLSGEGGVFERAKLVCHVLLIETGDGLVLVDSGLGTGDVADPSRTGAVFKRMTDPVFALEETAIEQVKAAGFSPADVRHIVLTHLDVDHAGGLGDFPEATVHVFKSELEAGLNPAMREKTRYRQAQWEHGPKWQPYETEGDRFFGLESVRAIEGLDDPEVAIVPLQGHTRGHSGVAVRRADDWLLHCGDSYFSHRTIERGAATPPGLKIFQSLTDVDRKSRLANEGRLRALHADHADEVKLFCAHDKDELEALSDQS